MNALLNSATVDGGTWPAGRCCIFCGSARSSGLAAGACRLVLRRASANVRYAAALACLAVLAALPVGIGAWVRR